MSGYTHNNIGSSSATETRCINGLEKICPRPRPYSLKRSVKRREAENLAVVERDEDDDNDDEEVTLPRRQPRTGNKRPRRGSHVTRRDPFPVYEDDSAGPTMSNTVGAYGVLQGNTSAGNSRLPGVFARPISAGPHTPPPYGMTPDYSVFSQERLMASSPAPQVPFLQGVLAPNHSASPLQNIPMASTWAPQMNVGPGIDPDFGDLPPIDENAYPFNLSGSGVDSNTNTNFMPMACSWVPPMHGYWYSLGGGVDTDTNPNFVPRASTRTPQMNVGPGLDWNFGDMPPLDENSSSYNLFGGSSVDTNININYMPLAYPPIPQLAVTGYQHQYQPMPLLEQHHPGLVVDMGRQQRVAVAAPDQQGRRGRGKGEGKVKKEEEKETGQGRRSDLRDKKLAEAKKLADTGAWNPSV